MPTPEKCSHQVSQYPGSRKGGGEELRQLSRHAGHLHGRRRQAPDRLPAVQGVAMHRGHTLWKGGAVGVPWVGSNEERVSLLPLCHPHQAQQGV